LPTLLVHLAAIDHLARHPRELPPAFALSLAEDLEYARFGAALPDLPFYAGLGPLKALTHRRSGVPPYARMLHTRAPVGLGLKLAQLVATGSFVGRSVGRALLTGYFAHLVLDRTLHPVVHRAALLLRGPGESARSAHQRVEWLQSHRLLEQLIGVDPIGRPGLGGQLRILKRPGLPVAGVGRGLYLLVRTATEEVLGQAPGKREFDGWVRGLYLYARMLRLPWPSSLRSGESLAHRRAFEESQVPAELDRALERTREVVARVATFMARGDFSLRGCGRFLAAWPEGAAGALE
jgi:hypothetical protein